VQLTYHSFRMSTTPLIRLLSAWWRGIPLQPSSPADAAESGWKETWSNLLEGMVGEFAFIRVDVIGHSRISRENPSSTVDRIFSDFEQHVESIATAHKGRIWNWAGDGGLIVFYEGRQTEKVADALTAARTLLDSLIGFNAAHPFDQPDDRLRLRIAIHCGTARYRSATGRIHSAAINYVAHLEHERTHPNSISISEPVYRELSRGARQQFVSAGTFEDVPIYTTAVEKGSGFPGGAAEWRTVIATPLRVLVEKLRGIAEDAVIVAFDRSSAAIAGMLAPNLAVRVVVVLGREHFGDPYEKYAALNGPEIAVRGRVLFVSISLDSADAVVQKLSYFENAGVHDVLVVAMFITPNALGRLHENNIDVVYAEERELPSEFFDRLPWLSDGKYDHRYRRTPNSA